MLKTNEDKLVKISVQGEVSHPTLSVAGYNIGADGVLRMAPGVGGITYNKRVGDPCVGLAADHVEPGVSLHRNGNSGGRDNAALNFLSCIGNSATVITGDARGKTGTVTGTHGGIEHVIIDFDEAVMDKMAVGDKVQIKAFGMGLELLNHPDIRVLSCDPGLLKKWKVRDLGAGRLRVPVAALVPARIMGSGLGNNSCHRGDYDIQTFDAPTVQEYKLDKLRFGDFVAIMDADHSFGRIYKSGAVSVGVVLHSDSEVAVHGPVVTSLLTSARGLIEPVLDPKANLADVLGLRKKTPRKKIAKKE